MPLLFARFSSRFAFRISTCCSSRRRRSSSGLKVFLALNCVRLCSGMNRSDIVAANTEVGCQIQILKRCTLRYLVAVSQVQCGTKALCLSSVCCGACKLLTSPGRVAWRTSWHYHICVTRGSRGRQLDTTVLYTYTSSTREISGHRPCIRRFYQRSYDENKD